MLDRLGRATARREEFRSAPMQLALAVLAGPRELVAHVLPEQRVQPHRHAPHRP